MPAAGRRWQELLVDARTRLESAGIEEAPVKLRWVAAHLLRCGLLDILRHTEEVPPEELLSRFETAVDRLAADEPVQYVIGETDFMGLRIRCDRRALIPRPETELLVTTAEDFLRERSGTPAVVDACTGTGCVACALARRVPRARISATDISPAALNLARENARDLAVDVEFIETDLLEGIPAGSADLVVSNPPYVARAECGRLPRTVRDFEPHLALDGGEDGLAVISRLVSAAARVMVPDGCLMMEIGESQADAVREILCQKNPTNRISLKYDCAGQARVVTARQTP